MRDPDGAPWPPVLRVVDDLLGGAECLLECCERASPIPLPQPEDCDVVVLQFCECDDARWIVLRECAVAQAPAVVIDAGKFYASIHDVCHINLNFCDDFVTFMVWGPESGLA